MNVRNQDGAAGVAFGMNEAFRGHKSHTGNSLEKLAKCAKRLAGTLLDDPAREGLLNYLAELEETAAQLETGVPQSPSGSGDARQRKPADSK